MYAIRSYYVGARAVVILVGERPGLSSPDSLGLYFTQGPKVGLTDERRNCISNVRPAGMSYEEAAYRLHYLLSEGRRRHCSGVALKDETASQGQEALGSGNFLFVITSYSIHYTKLYESKPTPLSTLFIQSSMLVCTKL